MENNSAELRKLDVRISEVMGEPKPPTVGDPAYGWEQVDGQWTGEHYQPETRSYTGLVWPPLYSSDIFWATKAKEWLYREYHIWIATGRRKDDGYTAGEMSSRRLLGTAKTEAHAICLAVLRVVSERGSFYGKRQ